MEDFIMKDEKKEVDNSSHKFKNYWKNEGAKLKEMTFGEKISYIVEYYKYYFIAILIVVLLVVGITASIKHNDLPLFLPTAWNPLLRAPWQVLCRNAP